MKTPLERLRRHLLSNGGLPIVWIALTCLVLLPVWNQRLLPMLDTPNHLALVRGWHDFYDPASHVSDYYTLRIRLVPYILFYSSIHFLMYLFSIEVANKIFLSTYLILFPLSVLALARAFKRSPWLAVGAFALAFNQNWIYGFTSYLMSTVFLFFSLALLIRYLDEGRDLYLWLLAGSAFLAYFGHILPWFCLGLCAIALLLLDWRRFRRVLAASLAMLPSAALAAKAWYDESHEHTYMKSSGKFAAAWRDFPTSVIEFPKRVMELFPGSLDMVVLVVVLLTPVGLAFWKGLRSERAGVLDERRLRWMLIVLGVTYLSLPYTIDRPVYWWYVAARLPSMMAPLLLLLPALELKGARRWLLLPTVAACIALPIQLARLYRDFSSRNAGFMRLVGELPKGSKTLVVVRGMTVGPGSEEKSGDPATSAPVYWHFSSWPMALRGGYDPFVFDQGIPIRPKTPVKAPNWAAPDKFEFRQAPTYDYYLVRRPPEIMEREPALKVLDQIGEWTLFQRIHDMTDEP